jgi:hypothetical protein
VVKDCFTNGIFLRQQRGGFVLLLWQASESFCEISVRVRFVHGQKIEPPQPMMFVAAMVMSLTGRATCVHLNP